MEITKQVESLYQGQNHKKSIPLIYGEKKKGSSGYDPIIPASKPPGHAELQEENVFQNQLSKFFPLEFLLRTVIGVVGWWGVDLFVLATATGGMALGVGLALKETLENYFAYILIRKDKIFTEGDRVQLESGYNGYVHRITPQSYICKTWTERVLSNYSHTTIGYCRDH